MDTYEFSLTLTGVSMKTPNIADLLYGASCDDGLVCSYGDTIFITFDREAVDYQTALNSAIKDVGSTHVDAKATYIDNNELEDLLRGLAVINPSNTNLDSSEVEISICHSPMSLIGSAEVGVEIKHIRTGIIVRSVELCTQHKNKLAALEILAERLLK